MRISESWPTSIIESAREISQKKIPSERHVAIIETMEQALLHLRKFLLSEYAHTRCSRNTSEKLEQTLKKKNPRTIAFGDSLNFIRVAWKFLGENSHLGKNQLGKKLEGEDFQTVNELCSSWAAIREIWENHPEPQQQTGMNYKFTVPLLQSKFKSKDTNLNGLLNVFVECRNAKHHPKDYSIGEFTVNLELTDSYYEFINPILEKGAKFLFDNLTSIAERIKKYKVERVEVIGEEHHAHFLSDGYREVVEIQKKVTPNQVVKVEEWYFDKENLLFKAHDLIPNPLPEEAPAPLPESVTQEDDGKGDDGKADEKNEQLTKRKKPPGIDRTPFNVPFQSIESRFIGRDETLNNLRTELENGQAVHTGPCVLIEGMGGMGKSQLTVEYAHKFRKEYPSGVLWFVANEKAEPQLARFAVDQLGYPEEDKDESLAAMTRLWMNSNKDFLLILDNLDEENESEGFLPREHKNYHLIGTARERFSADWNPLSLDELSSEDAQLLLVEYMAGYGRDFLGTPEIAELSQALQHHPLALELAGCYMCKVEIAPSKYLEIFKRKGLETKGLTSDGKTKGTGHLANLAATLAIDFDQLSESPEISRFLSIFSHWNGQSISLGLLAKMAGIEDRDDAMLSVKEAATYSLLHLSDDERVRMHPFMAQALRAQVLEQVSTVTYEDMAEAAVSWLAEYRFEEYAQRVALELDSLNKLLEECRKEKLDTLWPQLARELSRQFNFQARYEESHQLAELAIQAVKDQDLSPAERVRYLLILSDSLKEKALYTNQLQASQEARDFLEPVKNEVPELWVETLLDLNSSLSTMALYKKRNLLVEELAEFAQSNLELKNRWRGAALTALGLSLASQAKYEQALKVHQDAYQFLKVQLGDLNPWTVHARSQIGDVISSLGKYKEALSISEEILRDVKSMYGDEHSNTADCLSSFSFNLERNGNYLAALEAIDRGLAIIRETYGKDHPKYAKFLSTKAGCLGYLGRYIEALELAKESLSINLRHYPERHPTIGHSHGNVGHSLENLHEFKAAKDHLLVSYEIDKSIYGDEHINTGTAGNNLANCLDQLGQTREALKLYEKAVEIDNKTYGKHHPESATALGNLGSTLSSLGKHEQGLGKMKEAVYIKEDTLGKNHPSLASSIRNLVVCLKSISKFSDALELEHRVLGIVKLSLGDKHPRTVESMRRIAQLICLTNGDLEEAHSLASQAYEISCETMGEESAEAAFGLSRMGMCLSYQKKHEEELKVLRQAYNLARQIFDKKHPSLKGFKIARDNAKKRVNKLSGKRPGHGNAILGRRHRKKK